MTHLAIDAPSPGNADKTTHRADFSTLELRALLKAMSLSADSGKSDGAGSLSYFLPENQPSTTVMRFSVRVPVLSEQMAEAPPMVSQAASTRTKLLSCIGDMRKQV